MSPFLLSVVTGLAMGLSLIVAIGAQNAYVLRQGLRGDRVWLVVAICIASDVALITGGVAGAGTVLDRWPHLADIIRIAGAAFLGGYALLALRRVLRPATIDPGNSTAGTSAVSVVVLTALALTWLNPHVYLDTVLLLGSVAQGQPGGRWAFGAGAALASIGWFAVLGGGATRLRPIFARPHAWRIMDGVIAAVMATLAGTLLVGA